jgi:hypothetical protein
MTTFADLTRTIDSCYAIFVRGISEPDENVLRLVLQEAEVSSESESRQAGNTYLEGYPIRPTEHSRTFELTWTQYVAYSVTNESFASAEDDSEIRVSGRRFRIYSKSRFLDFVSGTTIASEQYPAPMTHFCVISENHVINIVSTQLPEMRILTASSQDGDDEKSFLM